ncbi:hypothetical protein LCGC14_0970180 [marine sediment metagenome]|uniref:Uncharacterized protein n=1 Tax=marine sediment metagenome TaxID=412755 RepID=A0A0F9NBY7_9ZZZZ
MDFDISEIKEEFEEIRKDVERIIYMCRRYGGKRDAEQGKVWFSEDLNELDERIKEYFENPESFDWNQGKCIGEDEE